MERRKRFGLTASSQQHTLSSFAFGDGPGWYVFFLVFLCVLCVCVHVCVFWGLCLHECVYMSCAQVTCIMHDFQHILFIQNTHRYHQCTPTCVIHAPPHTHMQTLTHTHYTPTPTGNALQCTLQHVLVGCMYCVRWPPLVLGYHMQH